MNKQAKILVVDDEPIDLRVMTSALKERYQVIPAQNGKEAIDLTKQHKPDLILLDVMMTELSGYEVCMILKNDIQYADIPIVFVTAFNAREGEIRGLELGGIDYIVKPINFELLNLRIKNQLLMKKHRELLAHQKEELEATLARIKRLEGLIPICMYCKQIKDDHNDWNQLEKYISDHSEVLFSHGICPKCMEDQLVRLK